MDEKVRALVAIVLLPSLLVVATLAVGCAAPPRPTPPVRVQVPTGPTVERRGYVQLYLEGRPPTITVLHAEEGNYVLEAAADIENRLPAEDVSGGMIGWRIGPNYEYLVRGVIGQEVSLRSLAYGPGSGKTTSVFHVKIITRTK